MNAHTIITCLKDELGMTTGIIALKRVQQIPEAMAAYGDKNHICYMMGEALAEGRTFYTTLDEHVCLLGCAATGLDPALVTMDAGQRDESDAFHVNTISIFPDEALQAKAEKQAEELFPRFEEPCRAVVIGPFEDVAEPDVLILLGNAWQVHRLTRAYAYATGSFVKGYAGMGVCRMILPNAFINKEPAYTVSDRAWRRALNLAPDQMTLAATQENLKVMIENLEATE